MIGILSDILLPVYLVVGVGFLVGRRFGIGPDGIATLSYWVLGPAFIFDVLAGADIEAGEVVGVVGASLSAALAVGVVAWLVEGGSAARRAATAVTSLHGNVGNFGLAMSAFAFGSDVLPVAGIVMVTINTLGFVVGVGLATAQTDTWRRALRRASTTPLTLAVIPALVVNASNTSLPTWLDRPVSRVAGALIPVMLLTLGIQLTTMREPGVGRALALPLGLKLVLAPLAAAATASLFSLGGDTFDVVVLQAAMPAAVFTSVIALEHDLEPDYVTSVVLTGTLASAATIPVVLALL